MWSRGDEETAKVVVGTFMDPASSSTLSAEPESTEPEPEIDSTEPESEEPELVAEPDPAGVDPSEPESEESELAAEPHIK